MTRIGTWSGRALEIRTAMSDLPGQGGNNCAVILQSVKTGRILGVAAVDAGVTEGERATAGAVHAPRCAGGGER